MIPVTAVIFLPSIPAVKVQTGHNVIEYQSVKPFTGSLIAIVPEEDKIYVRPKPHHYFLLDEKKLFLFKTHRTDHDFLLRCLCLSETAVGIKLAMSIRVTKTYITMFTLFLI